jgi:hypothetical protein
VNRVVVLGRGGAGKSAVAVQLGMLTGLPVIELDKYFWSSDLTPLSVEQYATSSAPNGGFSTAISALTTRSTCVCRLPTRSLCWISRCGAARRSRENLVFWRWLKAEMLHRVGLPELLTTATQDKGLSA